MADKRPDKPSSGTLDLFGEPARSAPPSPPRGEPDATAQRGSTGAGPHATAAPQQSTAYASPATPVEGPRTYRVAEIVRLAGRALEARFADVWVEGEISGYRPQQSGHGYFNLKDADAVLPAVMFRSALGRLRFRLADGLTVRARGRLSIYEASGKFQLYVEAMEPVGLGALQLAFEQLKRKLEAEGLFAAPRKRALPFLPRRIGVATSASGAVIRDIIRVAGRRGGRALPRAPPPIQPRRQSDRKRRVRPGRD